MESLLILLAIVVVVGVPGGIIVALLWLSSLSGRVRRIEDAVVELSDQLAARTTPSPRPTAKPAPAPAPTEAAAPARAAAPWGKSQAETASPRVTPEAADDIDRTVARVGPRISVPDLDPVAEPSRPRREGPSLIDQALKWLSTNWFYAVAAVSLALAGIFLVQYGMEQGLLPPRVRVFAALAFGVALIVGGEYIRRRWGDGEDVATAHLPSVLSSGGVVTLFGAILGARHLYDLIGQGQALAGLVVVALGSIVLGWFHGPLLIAVGMVGGAAAPFVVGGGRGSDLRPLHGLFAMLAFAGLAVDMVRRWWRRWISWLALAVGFGASVLLVAGAPETTTAFIIGVTLIALSAMALPVGRILPDHSGPSTLAAFRRGTLPDIEVVLAGVAVTLAAAFVVLAHDQSIWVATGALVVLLAALSAWARSAEGLEDLALIPPAALLGLVLVARPPDGDAATTLMLMAGGAMSLLAFQRSLQQAFTHRLGWAFGTVLIAPVIGIALHLSWGAPLVLGYYSWALHALAVAAGLVGVAGLWAARDGDDRLRTSLAGLVALTVIAYALGQIAGEAALTAAVALMAALAAWFDRRFNLPLLGWFVVLAAPFVGWRLLGEPGVLWHVDGDLLPVLLSMLAPVAGFALAWLWLRGRGRPEPEAVAETAAISVAGYAVTILLWRVLRAADLDTVYLTTGLTAFLWLLFAWAQAELRERGGRLPLLRTVLAGLFFALGAMAVFSSVTLASPLFGFIWDDTVEGPPFLNTLLPAYLAPALLLLFAGRRMAARAPDAWFPKAIFAAGAGLAGHWVFLAIRHLWRGPDDMQLWSGFSQPEITSYTVALLILGAALFYQGVAKGSNLWRRAGVIVLGATVAKVFLIDAASLGGLLRVGAFVGLAFALAGLAWLDRWAGGMRPDPAAGSHDDPGEPSGSGGDETGAKGDASGAGANRDDRTGSAAVDPDLDAGTDAAAASDGGTDTVAASDGDGDESPDPDAASDPDAPSNPFNGGPTRAEGDDPDRKDP
ncbi:DUF2339 domain-containing protein [Jannaschia pohangensis]|uniref:Uncharacterized membrane protein n=1 Tax=Jannaschia pohangensis TaxID=390807 RepID=A0A1I3M5W5_9RHOB|nr:DUF2339 domain-containing protein [Jannaschia pohangensis]SFI92439.1 Uncharacterized membrane protein [Jannaschia pohangensis]